MLELVHYYYEGIVVPFSILAIVSSIVWFILLLPRMLYIHARGLENADSEISMCIFTSITPVHYAFLVLGTLIGFVILFLILLPIFPILLPILFYCHRRGIVNKKVRKSLNQLGGNFAN